MPMRCILGGPGGRSHRGPSRGRPSDDTDGCQQRHQRTDDKETHFKMGLVDAIMFLRKSKPPPTHQRGQDPIDGIFLSPLLLKGAQGGYLAFDNGLGSNHRGIWLDIPDIALYGENLHTYTAVKARRLQCKDLRIVQKYNNKLHNILQGKQIFQ